MRECLKRCSAVVSHEEGEADMSEQDGLIHLRNAENLSAWRAYNREANRPYRVSGSASVTFGPLFLFAGLTFRHSPVVAGAMISLGAIGVGSSMAWAQWKVQKFRRTHKLELPGRSPERA